MDRPLKFRIWSTIDWDEPKMLSWEDIRYEPLALLEKQDLLWVMQYTGLQDRNGVDIYEGDIVKTVEFQGFPEDELDYLAEPVDFDQRLAQFRTPMGAELKFCEVIGNVYENPDLLTRAAPAASDGATG